MPDTLFISYKSEENPFALQLAAALKNRGINIWIDRLDIKPADNWEAAIDSALKSCKGLIAVITPAYLTSRYGRAELLFAFDHDLPIFPLLLRRVEKDAMPFWLPTLQWLDFSDYYGLDDAAYQRKLATLLTRIEAEQRDVVGDLPSAEIQYLTTLIADLESQQGVENYIALSAQSEVTRMDPRPRKNVEASLALLLKPPSPERDVRPATKKIDNIQQAVADHTKFVLIGDPGAGKTTTLRRLALDMARTRLEFLTSTPCPMLGNRGGIDSRPLPMFGEGVGGGVNPPLPFIAYLPRWSTEPTAADFIRRQWAQTNMGGDVLPKLHSGQVWLYLDGLNEMGGEGKNKAALLLEWLQSPDGPRHAIITCRQADYHDDLRLGDIPTVLVEPLTDEKIREFAVQYLGPERADAFLERVFPPKEINWWERDKIERRSLIHLARNPYLLAALALIFEHGGDLPRNTGALFQKLAMVLWERERLRQTPGWIPFDEMRAAFGKLAFDMIDDDQPIDVPLDYAESNLGNANVLDIGRSANFVTMTKDKIRFSHQLMLEYFAAAGLFAVGYETRLSRPVFDSSGRDTSKWDKVIVALCGIVSDPSLVVNKVVSIDAFLADDCLRSGIEVTPATHKLFITSLSAALHDSNRHLRYWAAEGLGEIGTPAIPALMDALHDVESFVRSGAAQALGKIGDPSAVPALLDTLHDADDDVRYGAARALGKIGDTAAIPTLVAALHDVKSFVRSGAAEALGNIGDPAAIPALLAALHDADSYVRRSAADALGNIGDPAAIPALLDALHDADSYVRYLTTEALGKIGDTAAIPELIERLTDTAYLNHYLESVCDAAAHALGKIGTPAIPALLDALHVYDWEVRSGAARALGMIGDPIAIPALMDDLHDNDSDVRSNAARVLGKIGDPAIPALLDALHDDANWTVRSGAARALGMIGDPASIPALLDALHVYDWEVRSEAADALGKIGDPAIPALLDALHDANWTVRSGAARALGMIGDPASIPALLDGLHDADSQVRSTVALALRAFADPSAVPALMDALRDAAWWVRRNAAEALGKIGDPSAVPCLIERLADTEKPYSSDSRRVCDAAAEALRKIGTPEALEAVRRWREEQGGV